MATLAELTTPRLRTLLKAAETSYSLARAARQDKGDRIENAREARARQRRDAIRAELVRRKP